VIIFKPSIIDRILWANKYEMSEEIKSAWLTIGKIFKLSRCCLADIELRKILRRK
jgi:hypothetical protein